MTENEGTSKTIFVSKVIYEDILFEQVYNKKTKTSMYVGLDERNDQIIEKDFIEENNIKYLPILDDLLSHDAVLLPEYPMDYESADELENEIKAFTHKWMDMDPEYEQKSAWYVMLTWTIENLHTLPYLRALGDYGVGKTRFLDAVGGLCYKPMMVGGAVRSAPIYRIIDLWKGTLLLDEFTLGKSEDTDHITQILNCGFQRGRPVLRCDVNHLERVLAFDAFGPKIMATRKQFDDQALESRCITEVLKTTSRQDIPIDLTRDFFDKRLELQNKLLMYRFKNWKTIYQPKNVRFGSILPRIKQTLSPFCALFVNDEERMKRFVNFAKDYHNRTVMENATSYDGALINAYFELSDRHNMQQQGIDDHHVAMISSTDIKNFLVEEANWSEKTSIRAMGKHMAALGFMAKVVRVGGTTRKSYVLENGVEQNLRLKYVMKIDDEETKQQILKQAEFN